jgi:hypothetical protein
MHSAGGNLKDVLLLEYDGKSYREFLILLGEDVRLSKKGRYLCMGLGGKYL